MTTDEYNIQQDGKPPAIFTRAECIIGGRYIIPEALKDPDIAPKVAELIDKLLDRTYYSDEMTKLPSGKRFREVLVKILQTRAHEGSQAPCTIGFCDLNHFKNYNEILGELGTNQLVKSIAKILRKSAGHDRQEAFVARSNRMGDEFLILMEGYSLAEARIKMLQIQNEIANKTRFYHQNRNKSIENVTMAFGLVQLPPVLTPKDLNDEEAAEQAEQYIDQADMQMHINKRLMKDVDKQREHPDTFFPTEPVITDGREEERPPETQSHRGNQKKTTITIDAKARGRGIT